MSSLFDKVSMEEFGLTATDKVVEVSVEEMVDTNVEIIGIAACEIAQRSMFLNASIESSDQEIGDQAQELIDYNNASLEALLETLSIGLEEEAEEKADDKEDKADDKEEKSEAKQGIFAKAWAAIKAAFAAIGNWFKKMWGKFLNLFKGLKGKLEALRDEAKGYETDSTHVYTFDKKKVDKLGKKTILKIKSTYEDVKERAGVDRKVVSDVDNLIELVKSLFGSLNAELSAAKVKDLATEALKILKKSEEVLGKAKEMHATSDKLVAAPSPDKKDVAEAKMTLAAIKVLRSTGLSATGGLKVLLLGKATRTKFEGDVKEK